MFVPKTAPDQSNLASHVAVRDKNALSAIQCLTVPYIYDIVYIPCLEFNKDMVVYSVHCVVIAEE